MNGPFHFRNWSTALYVARRRASRMNLRHRVRQVEHGDHLCWQVSEVGNA